MNIVVSDSLQTYMNEISRFPVMSKDEEFALAVRYYKTRDLDAAHRLVTSNLKYVVRIALEYKNYGCRLSDLIQEGNIGLMVAVKKFNPYKGFRLITYATWWIRSFIQEFIIKTRGLVRRGSKAMKKKLFYRKGLVDRKGSEEPVKAPDLATRDLSLDTPVDGCEGTTHLDMLAFAGPGQEDAVADSQEHAIVKKEVKGALSLLNDKERIVIENRVMAEEPASLQALGDKLGLTRERVRQIEKEAIKKLRKKLSGKTDALAPLNLIP